MKKDNQKNISLIKMVALGLIETFSGMKDEDRKLDPRKVKASIRRHHQAITRQWGE